MAALLRRHGAKLAVSAALAAIAVIAAIAGLYLAYPGYIDHTEPSIAALSWRLMEGYPVYHGLDHPDRTNIPYGPLAYGVHAAIFAFFGGSLATGKLAGLASALFVPLLFLIGWRRRGLVYASAASLLASGFVLLLIQFSVWNRPDPFIVLFVAAAGPPRLSGCAARCRSPASWSRGCTKGCQQGTWAWPRSRVPWLSRAFLPG